MGSDWKNEATDPALRLLHQAGVAISPGGIVANLDVYMDDPPSEATVREALDGIERENMARTVDGADEYYLVTDHGRDYVETEIDQDAVGFIE